MDITESQQIYIINRRKADESYSSISRGSGVGRERIRRFCEQNNISVRVHPNVITANKRTGKTKRETRNQKETYACKHCGEQYVRKSNRDGNQGKQYCSRECAFADVKAWIVKQTTKKIKGYFPGAKCNIHIKECVLCGELFTSRLSFKESCSANCAYRYFLINHREKYRTKNNNVEKTKSCSVCGKTFKTFYQTASICKSDDCLKEKIRRRKVKIGRKTETLIFTRDNWKCQLCGEKVSYKTNTSNPQYPTIDHIVPLSCGGTNETKNLQCACFKCNVIKGNKTMPNGEQLRLYG